MAKRSKALFSIGMVGYRNATYGAGKVMHGWVMAMPGLVLRRSAKVGRSNVKQWQSGVEHRDGYVL